MKILNFQKVPRDDKPFLLRAKEVARKTISPKKHKIGCIIKSGSGSLYEGASVSRTRAIGSTCAERMAVDRLYFSGDQSKIATCYLVGRLDRLSWKENFVCTPCGACLEMFLELMISKKGRDVRFVCASWDLSRILIANLSELFPQVGKGGWPYENLVGKR